MINVVAREGADGSCLRDEVVEADGAGGLGVGGLVWRGVVPRQCDRVG